METNHFRSGLIHVSTPLSVGSCDLATNDFTPTGDASQQACCAATWYTICRQNICCCTCLYRMGGAVLCGLYNTTYNLQINGSLYYKWKTQRLQ